MKLYASSILSLKDQSFFILILLSVMAASAVVAKAQLPLLEYQAEDYTAISGVSKATNHAGFTGSGFMDFGRNGTWLEWNNVSADPGTATLNFRYANGSGGNRQCAVLVNGVNTGNVSFSATGNWASWKTVSHTITVPSGVHTIRVEANTSSGGPNLDKMEVLSEGSPNTAPIITSTPITMVDENTAYSYPITATDADVGDTLTITIPVKPNWLNFDAIDTLNGTPTNADVGDHPVRIVVTDPMGATDTQTFTITVSAVGTPQEPNGDQTFDGTVTIQDADGSGNTTNLEVYGTSNLGPVVLDVAGGGVGPADSATYEAAPLLIKHDIDGDDSTDLNLAFDGDHLSTDAQPFIIQNTNPNGGITFQTGATAADRLTIAADGSVTIQGVTITDDNGSSVVKIPGAINASSVELPDGTIISSNPDQTLSIIGSDLTISGAGGNTVTLPSNSPPSGLVRPGTSNSVLYVDADGNVLLSAHQGDIPAISN